MYFVMRNKYCIIMAGGVGSRFWPLSRTAKPKQFLDILGTGKTFLRATFERFLPVIPIENFLVVTNAVYKDIVLEQLPELGEHQVLGEPIGRNTAPCIAYAAFRLNATDPDAEMVVTPADHLVLNESKFVSVINNALDFISDNNALMTIGIRPNHPNTGYGYIQVDNVGDCMDKICKVKTFTEKPDIEMARAFVESGEFFWNSGIFIWKVNTILSAIRDSLPDMYQRFNAILPYYNTSQEAEHIRRVYSESGGISIDVGVMEKAHNVYVLCSDFGWSDVGTWGSLYQYSAKDEAGNATTMDSAMYNSHGCIVKAPVGKHIVVDSLDDYIVVDSGNVLMICPKENEQNIKKYIEDAKFENGDRFI
jgi:mannose-1-phosphate guanylyltransferase